MREGAVAGRDDFPTTWTLGVCVCLCVSGAGNKITCGRLDALTGSLGGGRVLAHCFLVLLGPPSISVASLQNEFLEGRNNIYFSLLGMASCQIGAHQME